MPPPSPRLYVNHTRCVSPLACALATTYGPATGHWLYRGTAFVSLSMAVSGRFKHGIAGAAWCYTCIAH